MTCIFTNLISLRFGSCSAGSTPNSTMMCIAALVIGAAATTLAVPPEMVSIVGKIEHSGWHLDFSFIHLPAPVAGHTTTAEQFANVTAAVGVANLSRQGAFLSRSFE